MVAPNYLCDMKKPVITIGHKVRAAVWHAQVEKRIIVGLSAAVKSLSQTPNKSLFCILAPPKSGDSTTHMLEVLLEAYCYENDIYIIKVDTSEKLTRILGTRHIESCVLIQRTNPNDDEPSDMEKLTVVENELVEYCEDLWDIPVRNPIALPQ